MVLDRRTVPHVIPQTHRRRKAEERKAEKERKAERQREVRG